MLCRMITRNASGGRSYSRRMDSIGPLGSFMGWTIPDTCGGSAVSLHLGAAVRGPRPRPHPALPDAPRRSETALQNHHIGLWGACRPTPPICVEVGGRLIDSLSARRLRFTR